MQVHLLVLLLVMAAHDGLGDEWSQWTSWSQCRSECSHEGNQARTRNCTTGTPECSKCSGPDQETQACSIGKLDCGDWGQWSSCTTTCGKGKKTRYRQCNIACHGLVPENGNCTQQLACPTSETSKWLEWSPWGSCWARCGKSGARWRYRSCTTGNDPPCVGERYESQYCKKECAYWGEWSPFTDCSCKTSTKSRTRACVGGSPGVEGCWGGKTQTERCWAGVL